MTSSELHTLQLLAQEMRDYASQTELYWLQELKRIMPDLQHQTVLESEIVTFYSPFRNVVIDIISCQHDHPDAYWLAWKRKENFKLNYHYLSLEEERISKDTNFAYQEINKLLAQSLLIKVCGMRVPENIEAVMNLKPDMLGFIHYSPSKRDVGQQFTIPTLPDTIRKVGVFVNESTENIELACTKNNINTLQLHGKESVEQCNKLKEKGYFIIKVFSVDDDFNFAETLPYLAVADLFLFDTKGKEHGGNGVTFNWDVLEKYHEQKPMLLSGGIGVNEAKKVLSMDLLKLNIAGIDVNSAFEISPANKNIDLLKELFESYNRI